MADIPENVQVYLEKPVVAVPQTPLNKRGRPYSRGRVVNRAGEVKVRDLGQHPSFMFRTMRVRYTERGWLVNTCAARRVYTITDRDQVRKECCYLWDVWNP